MPDWVIALASALLGGSVSVYGAYLARRREDSLGMRQELYRNDLLGVRDELNAALKQVSPPSEAPFAAREITESLRRAERKAATGSRWDRRHLKQSLGSLLCNISDRHDQLKEEWGTNHRAGEPQAFLPEYFDEAWNLVTESLEKMEEIEAELARKI